MRRAWERLLAFVPTKRAAVTLFAVAFVVYWIESLGWPMAKGRDTWDYLAYYLQLFDSAPPLSELQLFRTPLTPLVLGIPMDLGGPVLLDAVFATLYATAIVAWSATALIFGRVPALFSAGLLLVYPAFATIYHQASSDAVFATGLAVWALLVARALDRPTGWRFVAVGAGIAVLVLIRPANQVLLLAALVPLVAPVAWRRRLAWSGACIAAAALPLAAWALHNGIRYDDATVARGGRAWVPFLIVFTGNQTISPDNGPASRRLADLIEQQVLAKPPFESLRVPLETYLRTGSNYETVRLIALSDRVLGRDENYDVLFDSALEAIREHPGTYFEGVAETFGDFLTQRPLREGIAPRAQTAPEPPPPTFDVDGQLVPNPQAHVLVDGVPYGFVWCASDYIDSCTVAARRRCGRTPRRRSATARSSRRFARGMHELPSREGVSFVPEILNRITPRYPTPVLLDRRRARRPRRPTAARLADDPGPLGIRIPRAADPRGLAGRRSRVRAPALPGVHRDGARGAGR